MAAFGFAGFLGLVFERFRYKRLESGAPPGFERRGERFIDPGSQAAVTVYLNRATGERRYIRG